MTNSVYDSLKGPNGEELPVSYRWLIAQGVTRLCPWNIWTGAKYQELSKSIRAEFLKEISPPNTSLITDIVPFASAQHMDDYAAFIIEEGVITEKVVMVHLTFSGVSEEIGYPSRQVFQNLWEWLIKEIIPETADWADEDELADLQEQEIKKC